MKNRLHRFIFSSLVIHALIAIIMLITHIFFKKNNILKKESFIFFDQPLPTQQQKTILVPPEKTPEFKQELTAPQEQPTPTNKPIKKIEPKEETPIYNDAIDLNYNMPTMVQKSIPEQPLQRQKKSNVSSKLQAEQAPEKTIPSVIKPQKYETTQPEEESTAPEQKTRKNIKSTGLVHFPELQETKPFQTKSPKTTIKKETQKLSAEELKKRALNTLLKQEKTEEKLYTPKTIDLHEYLALKEEQNRNNMSSEVATIQHSVQSTLNSDIKNMGQAIYAKQFNNHLVTSFHIARTKTNTIAQTTPCSLVFTLITDKYGKIVTFELVSSSGNKIFDELFVQAVKLAEPFPAIPNHLGINRWRGCGGTITI